MHKYIAYIDDDEDDRYAVEEAFDATWGCTLQLFDGGRSFLNFLHTLPDHSRLPDLIVLDVNMPGLTGWDILRLVREHERFRSIEVVLFSTARAFNFFAQMRAYNVRFFTKPLTYPELRLVWKQFAEELVGDQLQA